MTAAFWILLVAYVLMVVLYWLTQRSNRRLLKVNDEVLAHNKHLIDLLAEYEAMLYAVTGAQVVGVHDIDLSGKSDGEVAMEVLDMLKEVRGDSTTD